MRSIKLLVATAAIFICLSSFGKDASSAISYTLMGGRFGDNLITFIKAKWISYKYDMPFLYTPFPYSDQLMLHTVEQQYTDAQAKSFKKATDISYKGSEAITRFNRNDNRLYRIGVLFGLDDWQEITDIKDQKFIGIIKKLFQARKQLNVIELPSNAVTVAVHVRKGGDYEKPVFDERGARLGYLPLRFPPDDFYVEQIKKIATLFPGQQLYVYIFTDVSDPEAIVEHYKAALGDVPITFAYREKNNRHDQNVLEDFFSMAKFDCLIRPESGFSRVAQFIGNHKVVITPKAYRFEGNRLIITDVTVTQQKEVL